MKIILSLVWAAATVIATTSAETLSKRSGPTAPWDYGADRGGPSHWGILDPIYVTCDKGLEQSPVDINADTLSRFVTCASKPMTFDYKPDKDVVAHFNGHAVEMDWTPSANAHNNTITIGKKVFNLVQFHFHTPSEHRINGHHADAELHLVHRSPIDQSLAVVGVLLKAQAKKRQQLKGSLCNDPSAYSEDDSEGSIDKPADGDDEKEYDMEEGDEDDDEDWEEEDEDDAAEYKSNEEDETDFSSQDFDAESDAYDEEDENQADVNVNTVETINTLDTLDNQQNKNNNNNKNAKQQPLAANSNNNNNDNENNNIDNNQDNKQDTNLKTADAAVSTAAAAMNCKPPVDDTICTGEPPTGEEATHIDLPLKSVDFSPLIKIVKGFFNRWEYEGSLTTPPCSEHVEWKVMHESFPIGLQQLQALVDLQGYNAREINEDPKAIREPEA
ncbi:hypothetical protein BGZ96_007545 [Linnemannia gamsii]|uniref:carbonic anhydrase n=1 Tax=Linnemannia gamsii TaxID=64522 RepID=A0ABQ7K185_9FUNG|nr:hypothetical protein BGZ96_007545 [Linnemannia gamsii]